MKKKAFLTLEKAREIAKQYPTPWYIYDEKGIRENARRVNQAFAWNKGFREYFAVKATPNPFLLNILKEYGCGTDCSSMTELMMSEACGFRGHEIMFSSNDTPPEEFAYADRLGARKTIVIGESELEKGTASVKDMATGDQTEVALTALAEALR